MTILKEHRGYTWVVDPYVKVPVLVWKPIWGVYCPPLLEKRMRVRTFPLSEEVERLLIAEGGIDLERITKRSQVRYLVFKDGLFEVWSPSDRAIAKAVALLQEHVDRLMAKIKCR